MQFTPAITMPSHHNTPAITMPSHHNTPAITIPSHHKCNRNPLTITKSPPQSPVNKKIQKNSNFPLHYMLAYANITMLAKANIKKQHTSHYSSPSLAAQTSQVTMPSHLGLQIVIRNLLPKRRYILPMYRHFSARISDIILLEQTISHKHRRSNHDKPAPIHLSRYDTV